jgi:hypothetical protein
MKLYMKDLEDPRSIYTRIDSLALHRFKRLLQYQALTLIRRLTKIQPITFNEFSSR